MSRHLPSRRDFAVFAAAALGSARAETRKSVPIGLQQTAVGKNITKDLNGTIRAVGKMGYQIIEFSAGTFMKWTPEDAKQVRTVLNESKLKCRSTHNEIVSFSGDGLSKAIELNHIIGSDTLVSVRGPGARNAPPTLSDWKHFSDQLSQAADRIRAAKMKLGFHNHDVEFQTVEGVRPIDILAANKDITAFHLNVGLALKGGGDPVAFIKQVPGRIQSLLIQDFDGKAHWKDILLAADNKSSGLEFYLIQRTDGLFLVSRQGDDLLDFARQDLEYFRQLEKEAHAS
jgi:sugar phosphate isomerase/epimerase